MHTTAMLYCQDPLNPRATDQHFANEARAARELGARVALLDHDALLGGDAERAVERVPHGIGPLWYRGWMIPAAAYDELARALGNRGADLMVTAEAYRSAHELPGWYEAFSGLTPESAWVEVKVGETLGRERLAGLAGALRAGPGIVKDYVKSRKHEWAEACFIPDTTDLDAVARVVGRFVELQGEYLAGGVVLREFETFVGPEARVWWLDGTARLVTPHPDTPANANSTPDLGEVEAAVRRLEAPFVTTDLVRRADGTWRVVEVGDGQVSDMNAAIDAAELIRVLIGD